MKEIKFRAFHKPSKKMFNVYCFTDVEVMEESFDGVKTSETLPALREDCILMQYTGLKDIDGEEIYEGDIVKHFSGLPFLVVWDNQYCGWGLKNKNFTCSLLDYEPSKHYKILGNIYLNPELLEVK